MFRRRLDVLIVQKAAGSAAEARHVLAPAPTVNVLGSWGGSALSDYAGAEIVLAKEFPGISQAQCAAILFDAWQSAFEYFGWPAVWDAVTHLATALDGVGALTPQQAESIWRSHRGAIEAVAVLEASTAEWSRGRE